VLVQERLQGLAMALGKPLGLGQALGMAQMLSVQVRLQLQVRALERALGWVLGRAQAQALGRAQPRRLRLGLETAPVLELGQVRADRWAEGGPLELVMWHWRLRLWVW
jgi:hypothetical protein